MVRLVSGVLLGATFFAVIWFATPTVLLLVALAVAALAIHEYVQLFRSIGARVAAVPTLLATWSVVILVAFEQFAAAPAMAIGLVVIAVWIMAAKWDAIDADASTTDARPRFDFRTAALGSAAAVLAIVYIGVGLGTLVGIHVLAGRGAVILFMATIVISDSAQFYTGRLLGRRPLAPKLSPKKTVEGAIGGLVFAPAFLVASASYLLPMFNGDVELVALGIAIVVAGIAGDLFESILKRAAGVKDSSALIPGHGGVLDRIDALLFAAPIFYLYLRTLNA